MILHVILYAVIVLIIDVTINKIIDARIDHIHIEKESYFASSI